MQTGSAATHMPIDESVPVKRGLLSQALQTRGGGLEAKLTKALPTLHSPSLSISVFFLSLPHNKHTHTHKQRAVLTFCPEFDGSEGEPEALLVGHETEDGVRHSAAVETAHALLVQILQQSHIQ